VGVIQRERFSDDTQETGEGGVVSASPLPVSPTPTGVIPHRYSARGRASPQPVSGEKPPWHGFPPAIAAHCPPPLEGAGGGRVSGRAVGVFSSPPWKDVSG